MLPFWRFQVNKVCTNKSFLKIKNKIKFKSELKNQYCIKSSFIRISEAYDICWLTRKIIDELQNLVKIFMRYFWSILKLLPPFNLIQSLSVLWIFNRLICSLTQHLLIYLIETRHQQSCLNFTNSYCLKVLGMYQCIWSSLWRPSWF